MQRVVLGDYLGVVIPLGYRAALSHSHCLPPSLLRRLLWIFWESKMVGGGRMELAMYTCIYRLKICLVVGILVEGCVREKSALLASSCLDLNGVCFLVAAPATF